MQNKNLIKIVAAVLVIGFAFYWFQVRPSNAKKNCIAELNNANLGSSYVQGKYKTCLAKYGL